MIERVGGGMKVEAVVPHGVRVILTLPAVLSEINSSADKME